MTLKKFLLVTTLLSMAPLMAAPAFADDAAEIAALKAQNARLQKELTTMMSRLDRVEASAAAATKQTTVATAEATKAEAVASKAVTVNDKGALVLPGTGTTIKLGGYVKVDAIHDFSGHPSDSAVNTNLNNSQTDYTAIPVKGHPELGSRHNSTQIGARESRVNLTTETPTSYGPVKTVVEADFYGNGGTTTQTNSYTPRLRKAYGTFDGFLIGQNWSAFEDVDQIPETLDFNGPAGNTSIRQAQIRYTHDFKNGHTVLASIENPTSDISSVSGANGINRYPDFIAAWTYESGWGHVSMRALARNLAVKSQPAAASSYDNNAWGYGLSASGQWMPFAGSSNAVLKKDNFVFLAQGGNGIGRYMQESAGLSAAADSNNSLHLQNAWGGNVGYQHFWLDSLRSTVAYGHSRVYAHSYLGATTQKSADSVHANIIWSPVPSVDLGMEYIYGHRTVMDGSEGMMNRTQASATYRF